MNFPRFNIGLRIPFFYLLFGCLWILFSDHLLAAIVYDPGKLTEYQSYKGWAFVAASAIFIYFLLQQYLRYQKLAKVKLDESEERLRLALEAANQGIYDLNVQTGETVVNDIYAEMLGYDPAIFVETNAFWLERLHPEDREPIGNIYLAYINGKIPKYRVEFRQKTYSGDWIWILSIGSIVEKDKFGRPLRMLGTHTNINESKKSELKLARLFEESKSRLERIASLHEIDQAISNNSSLLETLKTINLNVKNHLKVDGVAILLFDQSKMVFNYADSLGFRSNRIANARVKFGSSLAGIAAKNGTMVQIHQVDQKSIDPAFSSLLNEEGFKDYCGNPLIAKGKLVGVLEVFHRYDVDPDTEWKEFFNTLSGQAALAIENAQLIEAMAKTNADMTRINNELILANSDINKAYDETIEGLAMALSLRDDETEYHSRRVTKLTLALAEKLDFTVEEMTNIRRGTMLHDIGKIGIPDSILLKPGSLTDDERRIIQQHPVHAYSMLRNIDYLKSALEIPYLHHEKWDGSGYPNGLKGDLIPLSARLFAVVDVYDALTSKRPYRDAWAREDAIAYIQEQSGKHFDPEIIQIFLSFINQNPDL
jgi:PAS domain S-box-containing protein